MTAVTINDLDLVTHALLERACLIKRLVIPEEDRLSLLRDLSWLDWVTTEAQGPMRFRGILLEFSPELKSGTVRIETDQGRVEVEIGGLVDTIISQITNALSRSLSIQDLARIVDFGFKGGGLLSGTHKVQDQGPPPIVPKS